MRYQEILDGLRDSTRAVAGEGRLVRAGLKEEQDTAAIMARFAWLYSDDALAVLDAAEKGEGRSAEVHKRARIAILTGIIECRTAPQQDRLTTFYARSEAAVGGERLPFYAILAELARQPNPARREALGEAGAVVMREAEQLELELAGTTVATIGQLGHRSYAGFWSALKEVDYGPLMAELTRVGDDCRSLYQAWVEPRMESAGHHFGDCPQWHNGFIRGLPEHDAAFTQERFEPAMRRTFERLGLRLFTAPSIHIDLEYRPAKNPRASVWPIEAGREVHLLCRPSGGNADYSAFLHEAGHALHFGLTDPGLEWALGNLGRSMAYPELWSFLMERVGHDPAWIAEAAQVSDRDAERIAADLTGVDLMMFTRVLGKFAYELALYAGDPLDPARGGELYVTTLSGRTGFRYDPRGWQFDRDAAFYSADYLRAWMAEASLEASLRERFGERWWAARETGDWLREQWSRGWLPEAEDTVAELGGTPWSAGPLAHNFRTRLTRA